MSYGNYGVDEARAKLAALRAQIEALETDGVEIGGAALSRSKELAREALSIADDVITEASVGSLGVAATVVSEAADGADEARASIRAMPIASVLIAIGVGVVLGHLTANKQPAYKSWL